MRRVALILLPGLFWLGTISLQAQIPPRKTVTVASAGGVRRLLVATPAIENGAEAAPAVELAEGLRLRLAQAAGGRYQVVSREALNRVLTGSGYEADAPLGDAAIRALGTQVQAAYVVSASIHLEADGRLSVTASLAPPSAAEPTRQTLTQESGQSLSAFAAVLAETLLHGIN